MKMAASWLSTLLWMTLVIMPCRRADAWGTGHIGQAKLVHRVLPKDLREKISPEAWRAYEQHYCRFPDLGALVSVPNLTNPPPNWSYFRDEATRHGFAGTLHDVMVPHFALLVECFRRGEMDKAMVWAGCITHLLGDSYACNHWPFAEEAVYQYGEVGWDYSFRKPGVKMGTDMYVDLGDRIDNALGQEELRLLADYKPRLRGKTVEEAALNLCVERFSGVFQVESLDAPMMESAEQAIEKGERGESANRQGMKLLAQVGAACAKSAADFIYTAYFLSRSANQTIDAQRLKELEKERTNAIQANQTLENTPAYAGLLSRPAGRAIGVIVCTLGGTGEACGGMGNGSIFFGAALLRTLHDQGIPYRAFQADRPQSWDLNPAQTPMVIARALASFAGFDAEAGHAALARYLEGGGRILYLGGDLAPYLPGLNAAVEKTGEELYPLPAGRTKGARVAESPLLGSRQYALGFDMSKNWFTGGYILRAPWQFRRQLSAEIKPLIQMRSEIGEVTVAAGEQSLEGGLRTAMAPLFLFYPGALDPQRTLVSLSHPVMDENSAQVLVRLIKAMGDTGRNSSLQR